jgi:DNA primase
MDIESLGYVEALRYLAKKYNIDIPEPEAVTDTQIQQQQEKESLYIVLNYAKNYYQNLLWEQDEGKAVGLSYFKERGFKENTIKEFELGYSLDIWDHFGKEAISKGYNPDILDKAGLIIRKEGKQFDRFRGRVIFPIHNVSGKVVAFGARILKPDKNQPKYLNSPETEVYHKSNVLYGLFQAKNAIRQEDTCYLVEGYTDVISLHQAGVNNVVASSGTSLTIEQIRLISRYTHNITVLYDGDAAGIKASLRGPDMILEEGLNVKVAVFPDGDDPDSYVRKIGAQAFKDFIKKNSTDFITFKTKLYLDEAANDPFKKAGIIKEVVESITKIPDPIKRAVFFKLPRCRCIFSGRCTSPAGI